MSRKINPGELYTHIELDSLTTWKMGGTADRLYRPKNLQDLQEFLKKLYLQNPQEPITWLGMGSNVLIRDGGIRGTVILTQGALSELTCDGELIRAEAGVASAQVARFAAKHNLINGEFLAGVPGSIGGALMMNAGAFGGETWRHVIQVETIDRQGVIRIREPKEFIPQYREVSGLKPDEWFIAGHFKFEEGDGHEGLEKIKSLLAKRADTQPTGEPCCGSVFRNPPGNYAAQLIESSGLKNFKLGQMQISQKHANFFINTGGAKASDAEKLIKTVQEKVLAVHGIYLQPEVKFIGQECPLTPFGKVGVLMGGNSAEREVSLRSGNGVLNALRSKGVDAHPIDVGEDILEVLQKGKFDRLFNVLHGPIGEDGTINGLLSFLKIPVTGSPVLGAALSMDKFRSKQIWENLKLPTAPYILLEDCFSPEELAEKLGFPMAIKPVYEGSSVGVHKVKNLSEIKPAFDDAKKYGQVIAEKWIIGSEFSVPIVGEQVLPSIKIQPAKEFYDYEAKYILKTTQYFCPSGLENSKESEIQNLVLKAFKALGCSGWGRVDVMQDQAGNFYLMEINTTPGMTATSLLPKGAKQFGWSYGDVVIKILEQTLNTSEDDSSLPSREQQAGVGANLVFVQTERGL